VAEEPFEIPFRVSVLLLLVLPLLLVACSTTLTGTLEITTTAREVVTHRETVRLNPLGDALEVPGKAETASLRIGDGDEIPIPAGAKVEIVVTGIPEAPGVSTSVRVDGKAVGGAKGRLPVRLSWKTVTERRLPPKVETVPLEMEPGTSLAVDRRVMYTPMPDSELLDVETAVRIAGDDGDRFRWVPENPPRDGRVVGRVEAEGE